MKVKVRVKSVSQKVDTSTPTRFADELLKSIAQVSAYGCMINIGDVVNIYKISDTITRADFKIDEFIVKENLDAKS